MKKPEISFLPNFKSKSVTMDTSAKGANGFRYGVIHFGSVPNGKCHPNFIDMDAVMKAMGYIPDPEAASSDEYPPNSFSIAENIFVESEKEK